MPTVLVPAAGRSAATHRRFSKSTITYRTTTGSVSEGTSELTHSKDADSLFANSEESDEENDELDDDPWTGLDRAPRQEEDRRTRWRALDDGEYDGKYDKHGFLIDGMGH